MWKNKKTKIGYMIWTKTIKKKENAYAYSLHMRHWFFWHVHIDIIMVPQNDFSGAFLYTEKGYRNVIVEKYYWTKD